MVGVRGSAGGRFRVIANGLPAEPHAPTRPNVKCTPSPRKTLRLRQEVIDRLGQLT